MGRYNRWTDEELERILRLREKDGLTVSVLAERFGTSVSGVGELLRKARKRREQSNAATTN